MPKHKLKIYNLDVENDVFIRQNQISNYKGFSYVMAFNGIDSAQLSLNIMDPVATPANLKRWKSNILIFRDDVPMTVVTPNKFKSDFENTGGDLDIDLIGYLAHLDNKLSDKLYKKIQVEYSTIVDDLITSVQARTNGTVKIDMGAKPVIGDVNETLEYSEIAKAIINQSDNINGFDFKLTPILDADNELDYMKLDLFKNQSVVRDNMPKLKLGDNVQRVSFSTVDDIANYIIAKGQGTGGDEPSVIVEDIASQKAYTRIEKILKFNDISNTNKLKSKAAEYLNYSKVDRYNINVTLKSTSNINLDDFNLGDYLYADLYKENTFIDFRGWARVIEIRIDVDQEGVETITPKLQFIN